MITFSVSSKDLKRENSFVPNFYYYSLFIREEKQKNGINYISLSNYRISDGEHSAIPRIEVPGIRYLYGRNIREGTIDFDPISDIPYISKHDYDNITRTHIKQNDVLVPIVGTIGKSAVYKKEYVGVAGIPRHIASIRIPEGEKITPEYLSVFFRSKYGKVYLYSLTTGNIQPLLSLKNLKSIEVPVLEKELIKKITDNERKANEYTIEANRRILEAKDVFYKGLGFDIRKIQGKKFFSISSKKMFDSDNWTPNNYNTKYEDAFSALSERFEIRTISQICSEIFHGDEVGSTNYIEFIDKNELDKPFIRTSDIVNYETDLYPDFYVSEDVAKELNQEIMKNDIIFTKDGKIGACGLITSSDNCIISSGIEVLRISENYDITPEYLFIALSIPEVGFYRAHKRTVIASTIPHLRPEKLKEIEIPILDENSRNRITSIIREAFDLKEKRKPLLQENDKIIEKAFKN